MTISQLIVKVLATGCSGCHRASVDLEDNLGHISHDLYTDVHVRKRWITLMKHLSRSADCKAYMAIWPEYIHFQHIHAVTWL